MERILYFTSPYSDYLADSVLHGLRTLLGSHVVDFPKCEPLYREQGADVISRTHGRGFTLYGLLDDIPIDRYDISAKLRTGYFDLVIVSSIHRQFGYFVQYLPWLKPDRTIILDGEDHPSIYPYNGNYWRNSSWRWLPRAHTRFLYFKREWTPETMRYRWYRLPPRWLTSHLPKLANLSQISFSIPKEKIADNRPPKDRVFGSHIVDAEVATRLTGTAATGHIFLSEEAYYADLQSAMYGITTKRAGWDCMRHYEIAANYAVPCFRRLGDKPPTCAPHGLDASNCIAYINYDDLMRKIDLLTEGQYADMQNCAHEWAKRNTTDQRARELLRSVPGMQIAEVYQ